MKTLILILSLFLTLTLNAQVNYSLSKSVWNFRTSNASGRKPIAADFAVTNGRAYNTADSTLYMTVNGVITAAYAYYPYSDIKPIVTIPIVTSSARYTTPKYQKYIRTSTLANNTPILADFTSPTIMCINWTDSTVYQRIAGVITKTFVIYPIAAITPVNQIYVATTGNDTTGNGTLAIPYRMPSKATSVVTTSGKTINIAAGTYLDNNYCELALGVNMVGAGKALTIIKTKYIYTASPTTPSYAYIRAYSSAITAGNQSISGIGFDGKDTSYRAITIYKRGNVAVHDCDFKDFKASAVLFYNIANNNMTEPSAYASGNSFYNNSTSNCTTYGIALAGHISLHAQENALVYGNTMIDLRRSDVGYGLISGLSNRKIKVYNNILRRNVRYGSYWNFTLEFRFSFGENEVYNNYVEGSLDMCNNMKKSTRYGLIIRDNTFGAASSDTVHDYGVQIEGTAIGITIKNNVFRNTRYGLSFTTNMPDHACLVDSIGIYRNLFKNIGYPATRFTGAGIVMSGSATYTYIPQYSNVFIYNNTLVGNGYALSGLWLKDKGYYSNFKLMNNIVYNFDQGTPYGPVYIDKNYYQVMTVDKVDIRNNLIYLTANSNNPKYQNITPTNVTISNTLKASPLFVSSVDFNLQITSPAVNSGVNVGLPFNGTNPDIGAFESNY